MDVTGREIKVCRLRMAKEVSVEDYGVGGTLKETKRIMVSILSEVSQDQSSCLRLRSEGHKCRVVTETCRHVGTCSTGRRDTCSEKRMFYFCVHLR